MRHAGVCARHRYGVKAVALAAVLEHSIAYLGGDIALGDAGTDYVQHIVQRFLGYRLRAAHAANFRLILGCAQPVKQALARMQLNAEHPLPVEVRPVRERKLLSPEHFHTAFGHCLAHELRKALACAEHAHRYITRNALLRRLDIARVGQQERPVERYEHRAVSEGKARCVALI